MKTKYISGLSWEEIDEILEKEHAENVKKALYKKYKKWHEMTDEEISRLSTEELKELQKSELVYKVEKWKHFFLGSIMFNFVLLYFLNFFYKSSVFPIYIPIGLTVLLVFFIFLSFSFYDKWDFAKVRYKFLLSFYKVNGI